MLDGIIRTLSHVRHIPDTNKNLIFLVLIIVKSTRTQEMEF
jgi:hypothetical protein